MRIRFFWYLIEYKQPIISVVHNKGSIVFQYKKDNKLLLKNNSELPVINSNTSDRYSTWENLVFNKYNVLIRKNESIGVMNRRKHLNKNDSKAISFFFHLDNFTNGLIKI
jgi:archaellin